MIRFLRMTNAERVAYAGLEEGRPCLETDTNDIYIGTAGGDILFAPSGIDPVTEHSARAYLNVMQQNLTNGADTKILYDTIDWDIGGDFDIANNEYVCPHTGLYRVDIQQWYRSVTDGKLFEIKVYADSGAGGVIRSMRAETSGSILQPSNILVDVLSFLAGDIIRVNVYNNAGGGMDVEPGIAQTSWEMSLIRIT